MKKLVVITPYPLDQRQFKKWGLEKLNKKFDIKVLDFTLSYRPDFLSKSSVNVIEWDKFYIIKSKEDLLKIQFGDEKLFLLDLSFPNNEPMLIWARRFFRKKKCITIDYYLGYVPEQKLISLRKIYGLFKSPKKTIDKVANFIKRFTYIKTAVKDIVVFGGLYKYNTIKAQHKIKAHATDYDIYLKLKNNYPVKKEPYVVFLDEDYVWHPDQRVFQKLSNEMKPETYYEKLSMFFKKFESETKLKVKFAAHPKLDTKKINNKIYNFDIIQGKTSELVKNCTAVLMHGSTSVSFAILFEKPVCYLYFKKFDDFEMGDRIKTIKNIIGGELINIEDNNKKINVNELFNINKLKYNQYIDTYIKFPGSPNKELVDILIDFLDKNFNENKNINRI